MIEKELPNQDQPEKLNPQTKFTLLVVGVFLLVMVVFNLARGRSPVGFVIPLGIITSILWLTAEGKRWPAKARISLGILSILSVGLGMSMVVAFYSSLNHYYEGFWLSKDMQRLEQLWQEGKLDSAKEAISEYNRTIEAGGTTASAISTMREYLDTVEKNEPEENKANALDPPSSAQ